jgi:hypothetical protein
MNEALIPRASQYATQNRLALGESLGSGKDGIVLSAKRKTRPASSAIKVHRFVELWEREKAAYDRLAETGTRRILGFHVPWLVGSDSDLLVIEMTVVTRPFVLDFAAAYLDRRPEFPEEVWDQWEIDKREQFEERWPQVQAILRAFEELGIYLTDVSPANIAFPV